MPLKVSISLSLLALPSRIKQRAVIARNGAELLIQRGVKESYRAVEAVASEATVKSVKVIKRTPSTSTIGATTPQAYWIERGRKPGPVPRWSIFRPILRKWANFKGLSFSDSALYLIGQKIRREGYKGRYPVRAAAAKLRPKVASLFRSVFRGL